MQLNYSATRTAGVHCPWNKMSTIILCSSELRNIAEKVVDCDEAGFTLTKCAQTNGQRKRRNLSAVVLLYITEPTELIV